MVETSWANFKTFVNQKSLSIQYISVGDNYFLKVIDGRFIVSCQIPLDPTNSDTIDFETNYKANGNKTVEDTPSAFASKTIGTKKLYRRVHGFQSTLTAGSNTILFTVPYNWCKITGMQVTNSEALDYVDLYILDSTTGTYSGVANYQLNQFGFTVQCSKDFYKNHSQFDADLYLNMQIKAVYYSQSAKTIGVNYILNEVK